MYCVKLQGPRGFTSAAGFEASARHREHLQQQQQHGADSDDGSLIVDTPNHAASDLQQAQKMDAHSLEGNNAPKFVGDKLVDPPDFDPTGAHPKDEVYGAHVNKATPHGVYSLVSELASNQELDVG